MRILILAGVAAAALTLTACNREEPAEAMTDEGAMITDSGSMGPTGDARDSTASSDSRGSSAGSGSDGGTGSSESGTMPAVPSAENPDAPPVREGAKEKAESTNLHPPTN